MKSCRSTRPKPHQNHGLLDPPYIFVRNAGLAPEFRRINQFHKSFAAVAEIAKPDRYSHRPATTQWRRPAATAANTNPADRRAFLPPCKHTAATVRPRPAATRAAPRRKTQRPPHLERSPPPAVRNRTLCSGRRPTATSADRATRQRGDRRFGRGGGRVVVKMTAVDRVQIVQAAGAGRRRSR